MIKKILDIIRNFIVFEIVEGKTIKKMARYQQYRAVHKTTEQRLLKKTQRERRNNLAYQGSGKSLTMVFLARLLKKIIF